MKQAVAYIRVSSQTQEDNTSLEYQLTKIKSFADSQSIRVIDVFRDVASGAKTENREGYKKMCDYISSNNIDLVISYKLDRIHRNQLNFLTMLKKFDSTNTSYISVKENIDTSTPLGSLMLDVLNMFSEYERKSIADRIKAGKKVKEEQIATHPSNSVIAGRSTFAYNSFFQIDEPKAEIVKYIFSTYIKLKSLAKVSSLLEANKGIKFCTKTIHNILRNQMYIGIYRYKGKKYCQHHKSIVTPYLQGKAIKILEERWL